MGLRQPPRRTGGPDRQVVATPQPRPITGTEPRCCSERRSRSGHNAAYLNAEPRGFASVIPAIMSLAPPFYGATPVSVSEGCSFEVPFRALDGGEGLGTGFRSIATPFLWDHDDL